MSKDSTMRESALAEAKRLADLSASLPGGVPLHFRLVPVTPEGGFLMGSRGWSPDEEPRHRVVLGQEYWMGTFAVTQEQWRAVARECAALRERQEPSQFKGDLRPVEQVDWHEANAFCGWLTERWAGLEPVWASGKAGVERPMIRLPGEAEWEWACRAGRETEYHTGDGEAALAEAGWFEGNAGGETHEVGGRVPNGIGLYDIHGNVWEWCGDAYDGAAYRKRRDGWEGRVWSLEEAGDDEQYWDERDRMREMNQNRALRGGSWLNKAANCRSAVRDRRWPGDRSTYNGFRVCLVRGPAE